MNLVYPLDLIVLSFSLSLSLSLSSFPFSLSLSPLSFPFIRLNFIHTIALFFFSR